MCYVYYTVTTPLRRKPVFLTIIIFCFVKDTFLNKGEESTGQKKIILIFKVLHLVLALSSEGQSSILENPSGNCGLHFKVALPLELVQTKRRETLAGEGVSEQQNTSKTFDSQLYKLIYRFRYLLLKWNALHCLSTRP